MILFKLIMDFIHDDENCQNPLSFEDKPLSIDDDSLHEEVREFLDNLISLLMEDFSNLKKLEKNYFIKVVS